MEYGSCRSGTSRCVLAADDPRHGGPYVRSCPARSAGDDEQGAVMEGIAAHALTKRYARVTAVDHLSFTLEPGRVTGFVGRNGAGKTTTLRMLLGLTKATSGTATVAGQRYVDLRDPMRHVGAMVDPDTFHPGRTGHNALRALARLGRIPDTRVDEVLAVVDLTGAAGRRVGG